MARSSAAGVLRRLLILVPGLCISASDVQAQSWRAPLLGRELVVIEKTVPGDPAAPRDLPEALRAKLGPDFVEYDSFIAARLPAAAARELTKAALAEKRGVFLDTRPPVVLPFQTFHPEAAEERWTRWKGHRLRPSPVPGLFLVRFAFPILEEWTAQLRVCGVDPILYHGNGVFLTRARNLGAIQCCSPVARYLAWADAFRATDRTAPELLDDAGLELEPYSLVFAPGTTREQALSELPAIIEAGRHMVWDDGTLSLGIRAGAPELEDLAETSLHLLSILPAEGEPEPSDERQGQILAGNYTGYPGAFTGTVTNPGYLTWLQGRGLLTENDPNLQTVAVFDTGYDKGNAPAGAQHPDLAGRLLANESLACYVFNRTVPIDDTRGHGTAVAGIIAGTGATNQKDNQNFNLGLGIAPQARLVAVQVIDSETNCDLRTGFGDPPDNISNAIAFSRVTSTGADKAVIANHSWNIPFQVSVYSNMARLFDQRVVDAAPANSGNQPMTMVVSAGNAGPGADTIVSPATAKNVITVGSTQNYRPSTEQGAPPNSCAISSEEANNIGRVSTFSSRGLRFLPYNLPVIPPLVTGVRVKPDLVAPGERVFSAVPDANPSYTCQGLCQPYWPTGKSYSFGSGTSFAAPAVTGVVALVRKWFMDRGVLAPPPTPSLIKAKLIATATDLGAIMAGDHRPSYLFGWGRVDLNRATDPSVARFYVNERVELAVSTGAEIDWQRTIDNPERPTFIVLVWSDPASSASQTTSQVPLYNDLRLSVELTGGNVSWRGNNFRENLNGVDDGFSHPFTLGGEPMFNDTMNNVEAIFIPARTFSPGQKIVIRVTGVDVPGGTQRFALYGYNVRFGS
jgi:hypothetical protein